MKKPQKKHLFARTCRVIGRFLLATGAVLCVASAVLALSPLLIPQHSEASPQGPGVSPTEILPEPTPEIPATVTQSTPAIHFLIPAIIVIVIVIFVLALAFRHYNDSIRKFIARSAKAFRLQIHVTELLLATIIWCIANLIIIFNAPVFAILTLPALIFNDLFFIFAWTSYGCPVYSI